MTTGTLLYRIEGTSGKMIDVKEIIRCSAVAFDMDGLMFNTEDVYWKAASVLLERRGKPYTDELADMIMGRQAEFCFNKMIEYHHLDTTWKALQKESEEIFLDLLHEGYQEMPGLFELIDRLEEKKIPKAICTSSSRKIMESILKKDDLLPRFDFTITEKDIVHGKPDPEIYRTAAEHFGISNRQMLVLEDSVAGCQSAISAGSPCYVILAAHNKHLKFPSATRILSSLADPEIMKVFVR